MIEERESGLGAAFSAEIEAVLHRSDEGPEWYLIVHRGLRRALVRGFPYAVYFGMEAATQSFSRSCTSVAIVRLYNWMRASTNEICERLAYPNVDNLIILRAPRCSE